MSSLMQHRGQIDRSRGVELLVYLEHSEQRLPKDESNVFPAWQYGVGERCDISFHRVDSEPVQLVWKGKKHIVPKLYRIWRKPAGMFGCWVVFRINGKEQVPDLSCPIGLPKLPRDAVALTDAEAIESWQR